MTETFKKDDFVQEKSQEKGEYAEGLCFDKIVWIFMISCIVGFLVETLWCLIKHGYIESRQSLCRQQMKDKRPSKAVRP